MNNNALFFKSLYENLDLEDNDENENICLISQEPLENDHITLACGHKFNYYHIFKEVVRQKHAPAYTEVTKLRPYQIKCPYCRNIQNGILPCRRGYEEIVKVNLPLKWIMKPNKCKYVFMSGKRKGLTCDKACLYDYCSRCSRVIEKRELRKKLSGEVSSSCKNEILKQTCGVIINSGKNKGKACKCAGKYNGRCGRHKKKE